jgi:hypothetical protein
MYAYAPRSQRHLLTKRRLPSPFSPARCTAIFVCGSSQGKFNTLFGAYENSDMLIFLKGPTIHPAYWCVAMSVWIWYNSSAVLRVARVVAGCEVV